MIINFDFSKAVSWAAECQQSAFSWKKSADMKRAEAFWNIAAVAKKQGNVRVNVGAKVPYIVSSQNYS